MKKFIFLSVVFSLVVGSAFVPHVSSAQNLDTRASSKLVLQKQIDALTNQIKFLKAKLGLESKADVSNLVVSDKVDKKEIDKKEKEVNKKKEDKKISSVKKSKLVANVGSSYLKNDKQEKIGKYTPKTTKINIDLNADVNADGIVNGTDLLMAIEAQGPCPSDVSESSNSSLSAEKCSADVNRDNVVNSLDLSVIIKNWTEFERQNNPEDFR